LFQIILVNTCNLQRFLIIRKVRMAAIEADAKTTGIFSPRGNRPRPRLTSRH